ncbi:serine/threonine phosphatase [Histoplasma capsulatum G186AR]|uniref:Serine/threonine phosphatase n=2 Tax=Ajellomyces capsulatus TaxID=5037 RepID=C0NVR1_AJECG|nr:serine/threonine phosphatase [Histoplasma capsulatum G186AR]EEH04600.1 serine/threonine phosphatase [Histoplasma capsulatum G186AR]KAG5296431.1 serine/threonine phosphatase [Histoplasma capsulatum]QSS74414.1 serine/threonine phosphatase [Histoplasma capsulatum G186AR]
MASFQILSDLHLESPNAYGVFDIPAKATYLALLGDIGNVCDAGFFSFIEAQLCKFQHVFLLLGNHEPFNSSWAEVRRQINEFSHKVENRAQHDSTLGFGKFVFLDQTRYDVSENLTVLGCTLYSHVPAEQEERVSFGLNDFYYIKDWTIVDHNNAHAADLAWLNDQVATISTAESERRIVIFTHHSPITQDPRAVDPAHSGSAISSGFASDLSRQECLRNAKVCMWAFGHTHFNFDFLMQSEDGHQKRIVSNQRGHYFRQAQRFNVEKVVTV